MSPHSSIIADLSCPDDEELRRFLANSLPDANRAAMLTLHVRTCQRCQSRQMSFPTQLTSGGQASAPFAAQEQVAPAGQASPAELPTRSMSDVESEQVNDTASTLPVSKPDNGLPVRLGRYFVIRELGAGSFARVYLARDPDRDRLVALKVPKASELSDRGQRQAFLSEARLAAEFVHPHMVKIHDCEELPDGRILVVMDYVEGATLKRVMETERLTPRAAAELVAKIADALDYAHRRGVWHRDVKPANILVDKSGAPFLADFGLALRREHQHQHANEFAGTCAYMSPEQLLSRSEHLDGRTDVWALGVVLYQLLTRQLPFTGGGLKQLTHEVCERAHLPVRAVDGKIPSALSSICDRCLAKRPSDRYATAAEMARDLRRWSRRPRKTKVAAFIALGALTVLIWAFFRNRGELDVDAGVTGKSPDVSRWNDSSSSGPTAQSRSPLDHPVDFLRNPLKRMPRKIAWSNGPNDILSLDVDSETLVAMQEEASGVLLSGMTPKESFESRFVVTIKGTGIGGFVWAFQRDAEKFPEVICRCMAAMIRNYDKNQKKRLLISELEFEPYFGDRNIFRCRAMSELAAIDLGPTSDEPVPVELYISGSDLLSARIEGKDLAISLPKSSIRWRPKPPTEFGLYFRGGPVTVRQFSLTTEKEG